ncbi:MAG: DNA-formamidopyrimidine glycosylase [bacterium]
MPELPEVETLRRELEKSLSGRIIKEIKILWPKTVFPLSPALFIKRISGQKILGLDRRAKMLIINLSSDGHLIFHLKMTGQLIFVPRSGQIISGGHPANDIQAPGRHTRIIFTLDDGSHLYFNDLRKFGWARLTSKKDFQSISDRIGLEPLSKTFTMVKVQNILKKYPNRTVKQILLDQTLIAGIGNIYADESAFLSHVLPMRKVRTLDKKEVTDLHKNIIAVLKHSIRHKGTSSKNYRRSDGSLGGFVPHLFVYGRGGEKCKVCSTPIKKVRHLGRGTHYCPKCQS